MDSPENTTGRDDNFTHTEQIPIKEVEPPKNVKVGLLFQNHGIFEESKVPAMEEELKTRFTEFFSPDANNILLLEDEIKDEPYVKNLQEAFQQYGSIRKAKVAVATKALGRNILNEEALETHIAQQEEEILKDPGKDPQRAYFVIMDKVVDGMIENGYKFNVAFETGLESEIQEESSMSEVSYNDYKHEQIHRAGRASQRDQQIVEQITQLLNGAEKQGDPTRIAAVFGPLHYIVSENLSQRIQSITTTYSDALVNSPKVRVKSLLREGKTVSEDQWRDAYFGTDKSIKKTINRLTSKITRPSNTTK